MSWLTGVAYINIIAILENLKTKNILPLNKRQVLVACIVQSFFILWIFKRKEVWKDSQNMFILWTQLVNVWSWFLLKRNWSTCLKLEAFRSMSHLEILFFSYDVTGCGFSEAAVSHVKSESNEVKLFSRVSWLSMFLVRLMCAVLFHLLLHNHPMTCFCGPLL